MIKLLGMVSFLAFTGLANAEQGALVIPSYGGGDFYKPAAVTVVVPRKHHKHHKHCHFNKHGKKICHGKKVIMVR